MGKHIGILACSAEGAALCYRTICLEGAALMGRHAHPEITMHTFPLSLYMEHARKDDWDAVGSLILASAGKLANAGAEFLICPDNTIHQAIDIVRDRSPLPWLHIAEEVAHEAAARGFKRVGLAGTKYLMEGPVYPPHLRAAGIDCTIPDRDDRRRIDQIIFDELVNGRMLAPSLAFFQQVIRGFAQQGCDAVILGCTEIPLLVTPEACPLPMLDSTRLLALAALKEAVK